MKEEILKEFDNSISNLLGFKDKMCELLSELIKYDGIQIHQLNGRLKERASLEDKIALKQDKYESLNEITDIVGIRIITYLESDVDRVANVILREFEIDTDNSIDKRKLKANQFGYRSLHFVVSCSRERSNLSEYKNFKSIKFEIQIRSILQHAWAEIEHDLGYKGMISIPDVYIRSFNRLAALLESADLEFDRLKKELEKYKEDVRKLIENDPKNVSINQISLNSFIMNNPTILQVQEIIKNNTGCQFRDDSNYDFYILRFNNFFKINNILELNELIETNKELLLEFINEFTKRITIKELRKTIVLFYLQHFLAYKDENKKIIHDYKFNLNIRGGSNILDVIRKAKENIAIRAL